MRILAASILISLLVVSVSALTSQKASQCTSDAGKSISTVCGQNDEQCGLQLLSTGKCLETCSTGCDQTDSYILKCIKQQCQSTNSSIQKILDSFVSCSSVSNLTFTALLLAILAFIF